MRILDGPDSLTSRRFFNNSTDTFRSIPAATLAPRGTLGVIIPAGQSAGPTTSRPAELPEYDHAVPFAQMIAQLFPPRNVALQANALDATNSDATTIAFLKIFILSPN